MFYFRLIKVFFQFSYGKFKKQLKIYKDRLHPR